MKFGFFSKLYNSQKKCAFTCWFMNLANPASPTFCFINDDEAQRKVRLKKVKSKDLRLHHQVHSFNIHLKKVKNDNINF